MMAIESGQIYDVTEMGPDLHIQIICMLELDSLWKIVGE